MSILKVIRYTAWTGVAAVGFLGAALVLGWWQVDGARSIRASQQSAGAQIGGSFSLVDHTGRLVTDADFRGRPMLVFFGFTNCPEVCPTTLFETSNRLAKLGAEADKLQVLFVSVDPERDTPQQLALYLQSFDKRIVGLTGTAEQVDAAVKAFKAYAKKVPTDAGYTMDHSSSVYVMDTKGGLRTIIDYHEEEQPALAKMRMVLK
jgi:protein SCO1